MKIANKHIWKTAILLGSLVTTTSPLYAQVTPHHMAPPPGVLLPASPTAADGTLAKSAASPSLDDLDEKLGGATMPGPMGQKSTKEDDKIPASVKDALKNLKAKTENLTLDDLNAAREAVARLDALIDIEKRLAELEKVKKDRETQNNKNAFASAIPASALAPPMSYTAPSPMQQQQMPAYFPSSSIDVVRIEGSNNHYLAFVKEGEQVHQIQTGDKLSDGSLVTAVSSRGIELKKDQTSRMVQVKDVQAVFSESQ